LRQLRRSASFWFAEWSFLPKRQKSSRPEHAFMHVRDESRLCSRGATRHSTAALRPCRFGRAAIALHPVNARHASKLLAPPLPAEAVRVKFSGMSFVRSSTESLQPEAFLSGDVGPEYLFPSSNHGWIQLITILLRDGEESQHRAITQLKCY
jgi:hypothetical protein